MGSFQIYGIFICHFVSSSMIRMVKTDALNSFHWSKFIANVLQIVCRLNLQMKTQDKTNSRPANKWVRFRLNYLRTTTHSNLLITINCFRHEGVLSENYLKQCLFYLIQITTISEMVVVKVRIWCENVQVVFWV